MKVTARVARHRAADVTRRSETATGTTALDGVQQILSSQVQHLMQIMSIMHCQSCHQSVTATQDTATQDFFPDSVNTDRSLMSAA